jgi:hypothetical protein
MATCGGCAQELHDAMYPPKPIKPTYTLTYTTELGTTTKQLSREDIEARGANLLRLADKGLIEPWNIAVLDESGTDVTFEFACFL